MQTCLPALGQQHMVWMVTVRPAPSADPTLLLTSGPLVGCILPSGCRLGITLSPSLPDTASYLQIWTQRWKRRPRSWAEDEHPAGSRRPLVFRADNTTPEVVQSVLLERGWDRFDGRKQSAEAWHLYWRASSFPMTEHANLKPWQCLNHHPGTARLTRKDDLAKLLKFMRGAYGASLYAFTPLTFIMPGDYPKFVAEYCRQWQEQGPGGSYWICKPAELSGGRGIVVFSDIKELVLDGAHVVQRYIRNPLLVGRYKCDLRLYVCVLGFRPLTVYLYQEGLVRFATEKFDLRHLRNAYAHLTNCSINKLGASYEKTKEVVGRGCKWTLSRFFSYLRSCHVDDLVLWQKIRHIVILTVLAIAPAVPRVTNCFELFGFDVLIDDKLKPWLLEVNYSPGLSLHCPTDVSVKRKLVHDIIDLIQLPGLRPRAKGRGPSSGAHGCSSKSKGPGPPRVCSALPREPLLQVTGRTLARTEPAADRVDRGTPKGNHAPQFKEGKSEPDTASSTRHLPKIKSKPRSRRAPLRSPLSPYTPRIQPHACGRHGLPTGILLDSREQPQPRAGNFVLIFPFNEATFGASRNGLDIRRIVQELQKLVSRQRSQEAERKREAGAGAWESPKAQSSQSSSGQAYRGLWA
ncbi:putative tubulin polyglutamylase TTLL2 [Rhynchocyon petersi]